MKLTSQKNETQRTANVLRERLIYLAAGIAIAITGIYIGSVMAGPNAAPETIETVVQYQQPRAATGDAGFVSHRLDRLEGRIDSLAKLIEESKGASSAESTGSDEGLLDDERQEPIDSALQDRVEQQNLEDAFAKQQIDRKWENDVSGAIDDLLSQPEYAKSSVTISSAQCGTTLCRVELEKGDDAAANQFVMGLPFSLPDFGSAKLVQENTDDGERILYFMARSGSSLPLSNEELL